MVTRILAAIAAALLMQAAPASAEDFPLCRFTAFKAPRDALIYAAGGTEARSTRWVLDWDEGQSAKVVEVAVNSPERPVVLLLGSSNPTVWHIGWTEGTKIAAVAASGNYRQIVVGLPENTKILTSSAFHGAYADPAVSKQYLCPYFTSATAPKETEKVNRLSKLLTGRLPDGLFDPVGSGRLLVGPLIPPGQPVLTQAEVDPADFDLNWALDDFLLTAVRREQIRPATAREYVQWVEAKNLAEGRPDGPIIVPARLTAGTPWEPVWAYRVIDHNFWPALLNTLPKLISGGRRSIIFYLPPGLDAPKPIPGAMFLSLRDGSCLGERCDGKRYNVMPIKIFTE